MKILVTWASKRGGTEGIGRLIAEVLIQRGYDVVATPVESAPRPRGFDAVILGSGLYANRWLTKGRMYLRYYARDLRKVPVWLFSSGPLDASADEGVIDPTLQVDALMQLVGALEHKTFGGRLAADAQGFPASAMAREHSGDWRNTGLIRAWAESIADELPSAQPAPHVANAAGSVARMFAFPALGWAFCTGALAILSFLVSRSFGLTVHAFLVPLIFIAVAYRYFDERGAREPLEVAASWALTLGALNLVLAAGVDGLGAAVRSFTGTWLPPLMVFFVTWAMGEILSTLPWKPTAPPRLTPQH